MTLSVKEYNLVIILQASEAYSRKNCRQRVPPNNIVCIQNCFCVSSARSIFAIKKGNRIGSL